MKWKLVDGVLYLDDGLHLALTGYNNIRIIDCILIVSDFRGISLTIRIQG